MIRSRLGTWPPSSASRASACARSRVRAFEKVQRAVKNRVIETWTPLTVY
jgi:hypothetical protein